MSEIAALDAEVDAKMDEVTGKFNAFVARQKVEIVKAGETYKAQVAVLQNEYKELVRALGELGAREEELGALVEREYRDSSSLAARIEELRLKEASLQQERDSLEKTVVELQHKVSLKRQELLALKSDKNRQSELILPETLMFEQLLGLKILGLRENLLKFVFTNIHPARADSAYSFELDLSEHLYKVRNVSPPVPDDSLRKILAEFNELRDLTQFLKQFRLLFKDL